MFFKCPSVKFSHDSRLRNAAVDVYSSFYGRLTPTCLPQGVRRSFSPLFSSYMSSLSLSHALAHSHCLSSPLLFSSLSLSITAGNSHRLEGKGGQVQSCLTCSGTYILSFPLRFLSTSYFTMKLTMAPTYNRVLRH